MTSSAGSSPQPEHSSIQVKTSRPIAAGQRPSFSGYGRSPFDGSSRPIARHGLKALKTSPKIAEANTSPTQNVIRMNVGAKLSSATPEPM